MNITIIIFLHIFLLTNTTLDRKTIKMFFYASLLMIILTLADSTDYWCSKLEYPTVLRYFTSATGYSLRPAPIIMLAILTKKFKNNKIIFTYFMLLFNMIIAYTSVITKWMFYFDENNIFHRGCMGKLPFIVAGVFLIILIHNSIGKYKMGNKREASVVFLIAFMIIVAVCMESIFKFKFIINGVGGISIVFYYLFMHTQTYKRDALTSTLNRHAFYTDSYIYEKTPMIVVSIDLNNLKLLNDKYGHSAGDKAIITVANCIDRYLIEGCRLYRIGGDEFMLLCPKVDKCKVQHMMQQAEKDIKRRGYAIAWGMCQYKENMDFEKVCSVSDSLMYKHKMKIKKQEGYIGRQALVSKKKFNAVI